MTKKITTAIFIYLIASSANAQSPGQPVNPNQLFPSNILNIHAPDSEGWIITAITKNGINFGKRGAENNETYGAQAVIFEMPPTDDKEALIHFVKNRISVMNPFPRFVETTSNYQYTEYRGYPCVSVYIVFDDTAAVTPSGKELLKLQVTALYCRHPVQPQLGFFAAYSHRGKTIDNQIEKAGKNFIDSINVPNQ
ncbi:MAG: hypothetical protein LBE32_06000 [Burkholderiales bacterium]|nr:hypothetical protein [Burkholderiales bacterium]